MAGVSLGAHQRWERTKITQGHGSTVRVAMLFTDLQCLAIPLLGGGEVASFERNGSQIMIGFGSGVFLPISRGGAVFVALLS